MPISDAAPLVRLEGVHRSFPRPEGDGRHDVLSGVDLSVARGEAVAIVGPSGSGKSTLLHLIGALDRPDQGRVLLGDLDLGTLDEEARAEVRRSKLGFVFQTHTLLSHLSALGNVLLPTLASGQGRGARDRAMDLLAEVGLAARAAHRPGQLSVGECQRVAVAQALMGRPELVLADEPTGALDQETAADLVSLLLALRASEGTTLVVVTHDQAVASRTDRILRLVGGRLVGGSEGSP